MTTTQLNTVQWLVAARRFKAAQALERARQVVRENLRYGYPVTKQHGDAIHAAELAYDQATKLAGWVVITR